MQKTLSIRMIVVSVVTFSIFLIVALMLFHFKKNEEAENALHNNQVMLFPVGREIKPFDLLSAEGNAFTQKDFTKHWTLLLFGFTHCNDVCPANLSMLGKIYDDLHLQLPHLQVVLVSLDPERDDKKILNRYVKQFHPAFIGVSGTTVSLRKLQSNLGIYALGYGQKADNYQIQHSSSIMLINPEGKWVGIFKFGLSPTEFSDAFHLALERLLLGKFYA